MRTLCFFITLCFLSFQAVAQKYCNEWIDYSRQYFKFPVVKDGIYRIDSATLSKAFNLTFTDPRNFQVFVKGQEQYLYVQGEADGKVNKNDFIEFYADGNIAPVDSFLYPKTVKYQPNPYLSMFNDSLFAYITLNNSINNKRFSLETDTNSAAYPAVNYVYNQTRYTKDEAYNEVEEYPEQASDPVYSQAEARGNRIVCDDSDPNNPPSQKTITTSFTLNPYSADPNLKAYVWYSGAGYYNIPGDNTKIDHHLKFFYSDQNSNLQLLNDTSFVGFLPIRQTYTLNPANLNNTSNFTFSCAPIPQFPTSGNAFMVYYLNFLYPQTLNLSGNSYYKPIIDDNASASKGFFNFSNLAIGTSDSVRFYDLTNGRRIRTVISGQRVRVVVPNGGGRKQCVITGDSMVMRVPTLYKVNVSGYFTNFKSLPSAKPYVLIYPNELASSALNYKNYRQSAPGGSYNVLFANVAELYDQFAYGAKLNPVAIRQFLKYLNDSLPTPPLCALLIGHGVRAKNFYNLSNTPNKTENLMPTMGVPSSDNLITAGLTNDNFYVPEIPIGRVAALTNNDVENYLVKVRQHESSGDSLWKKKVLHFIGGDNEALLNTLSTYMDTYKSIIEDTLYGAKVIGFKKNTTAPIQTNINDSIFRLINSGCSVLTFFGHGSLSGFDQAIDNPSLYKNTGRYPFLIANSCNSGDVFYPGKRSVSENFLFANQKGSVGFIATTDFGQDYSMFLYTTELYRALSVTKYGKGLGEVIQEACARASAKGLQASMVSLNMAYHGDPAIVVSPAGLPDYQIENNSVSFDLKKYADSIGVNIIQKNSGAARNRKYSVRVERIFPNNDSIVVYKTVPAPYYIDTLKFFMPIDFSRGIGLNHFRVKIDYFNIVAESIESNNSTLGDVDLFIPGGDIYPVYPYKYAIVPKTNSITLKASTNDPFAVSSNYRFQLDTCDAFTSPIQSAMIKSKGGVVEWNVNLPFGDSTVYFWRVSRDSTSPKLSFSWRESSFQTIGTKRGWGQAHFNQFKSNQFQFVNYKRERRQFTFENVQQIISCRNAFAVLNDQALVNYFFNTIRMSEWSCATDGWNFAVFDSISGEPKRVAYSPSGYSPEKSCACSNNQPFYGFGRDGDCTSGNVNWVNDLEPFINSIPTNNYVLAFTISGYNAPWGYSKTSQFSNSLYNAFESIGAKTIRNVADTVPYILFGRKGMTAGQGNEIVGKNKRAVITLIDSIKTKWRSGFIASEKIGPSSSWNSFYWRVKSLDTRPGDKTVIKLVGFKSNGGHDTLATFNEDSIDINNLSLYVNAKTHPYLQLVAFMNDLPNSTAPQLKRWQVLYDEAPECAINPLKGFSTINDTLQEGDQVVFHFPIENIGTKNFDDSLAISYWIEDNQRNLIPLPDKIRKGPFIPGQIIIDTIKISSLQRLGNNALWLNVNPVRHRLFMPEQYLFNNIGRYPFSVTSDITNPLLDVTFDGVRILNGDIVSSRPNILISLKDENKFLALNDTSAFTILLQAPNQSTQQRIYFGQGLVFTPASLPKNSCSIYYNPTLAVDGRYTLIIQAKDRSNNASGRQDYRVQFEVNNKPTVTGVLNYPNPFTSSTRFVFTLTGSEVPEVFTIQIMTITGKVVREITRAELGNLHIGRNISDYAWDGRDQYGDRLGNGVYLYRVFVKLNGENIEKSASGADRFFVKDYGKMVLMR